MTNEIRDAVEYLTPLKQRRNEMEVWKFSLIVVSIVGIIVCFCTMQVQITNRELVKSGYHQVQKIGGGGISDVYWVK